VLGAYILEVMILTTMALSGTLRGFTSKGGDHVQTGY